MTDEFRAKTIQLLPVLVSLAFGIACAYVVLVSSVSIYQITPFPEGVGSLGNGLYFVALAGTGAALLYLLFKRKKLRTITLITGFALTAAVLLLAVFYLSAIFSLLNLNSMTDLALTILLSVLLAMLVDLAIFRIQGGISNAVILLLGGSLGAFLGISIPITSGIPILSLLAIYDIYAVYRGPVGKIAQSGLDQLRGLSFSFQDVQMGLGDLTFYSMLTCLVLENTGPTIESALAYCVASTIGVLIGVRLVLKMLEKKGMFPGLPLPVLFGLLPLVIYFVM